MMTSQVPRASTCAIGHTVSAHRTAGWRLSRQPSAAPATSPGDDRAAARSAHPCPETVLPLPPPPIGLKRPLHGIVLSKSLNPKRKTRWARPLLQRRATEPDSIPPTEVSRKVSLGFTLAAVCRPWRCKRSSGRCPPVGLSRVQSGGTRFRAGQNRQETSTPTQRVLFFCRGILGIVTTGLTHSERALLHSASGRREPSRREPGGRFFSLFRLSYCCALQPQSFDLS